MLPATHSSSFVWAVQDVQRQFIELYNTQEKLHNSNAALNKGDGTATNGNRAGSRVGSRSATRQSTAAGRMHEAGRATETSGFGSGLSSSGPVSGRHRKLTSTVLSARLLMKGMPGEIACHKVVKVQREKFLDNYG